MYFGVLFWNNFLLRKRFVSWLNKLFLKRLKYSFVKRILFILLMVFMYKNVNIR